MKQNSYNRIIVAAIFIVALVIFFNIIIDGENRNSWPMYINRQREGSLFNIDIELWNLDLRQNEVSLKIRNLDSNYKIEKDQKSDSFCIKTMRLEQGNYKGSRGTSSLAMSIDPVCVRPSDIPINRNYFYGGNVDIDNTIGLYSNKYNYPFDDVRIILESSFEGYNDGGENQKLRFEDFNIAWNVDFPGWELVSIKSINDSAHNSLEVEIRRPYIYRIMTPLLIASLLIFISLIFFIKDISALGQMVSGMLFGIWGVKQILLTPDVQWRTVLDPLFVTVYTILSLAVISRILLNILEKKNKQ